jgi:hypothetical protein
MATLIEFILDTPCPHCKAGKGEPCTTKSGAETKPHKARAAAIRPLPKKTALPPAPPVEPAEPETKQVPAVTMNHHERRRARRAGLILGILLLGPVALPLIGRLLSAL